MNTTDIPNRKDGMRCVCGFQFSGPGEFRNCAAFITECGQSGTVCPRCGQAYVHGRKVSIATPAKGREPTP